MNRKAICIIALAVIICCLAACSKTGAETLNNDAAEGFSASQGADGKIQEEQSESAQESTAAKGSKSAQGSADNEINFEQLGGNTAQTSKSASNSSTAAASDTSTSKESYGDDTTAQEKEPATDKDGWINKWY